MISSELHNDQVAGKNICEKKKLLTDESPGRF
jgi:hypothetical protein